jgi:hypothetical protein
MNKLLLSIAVAIAVVACFFVFTPSHTDASSHREAPLISNDPLADNCDLYAYRNPYDSNKVVIVATYVPLELPEGGPNYASFGPNIRYEVHIKNRTSTNTALGSATDDIAYRFTFSQTNQDPTTFFNIRLGQQNLKTTYVCEKSTNGGVSFTTIISNGIVPPNNIGPRSINGTVGLNTTYQALVQAAIATASSGEQVFCGPRDDPFFVDLGGVFDVGQTRSQYGSDPNNPTNARDAVAGFNTHAIVMNIPINVLSRTGTLPNPSNILDDNFVIGVWASASRQAVRTLNGNGTETHSGNWIQVSRLGMPLTNEAVIPIGQKDFWNAVTPYSAAETSFVRYFVNPELGLYMDASQFGGAVPALGALRIQSQSYPAIGIIPTYTTPGFDFRNAHDGAFAVTHLNPPPNLTGTAFAVSIQPPLVAAGKPRAADLYPIFYLGVPNLIPYQLATGKTGGPLSAGKPFIHNFLPITQTSGGTLYGGDMLRLNMATPVTPRTGGEWTGNARMGLIRAAVLGLTNPTWGGTSIQRIPHMDGFPNGRRLEDDVTTIELQAVGGLVLAAVGLPFNDAVQGNYSDLASPFLVAELTYNAGPTANDVPLLTTFPYLAEPNRGYDYVKKLTAGSPTTDVPFGGGGLGVGVPKAFIIEQNYPNPFNPSTTIRYQLSEKDVVTLKVYNTVGQEVATLVNGVQEAGAHTATWDAKNVASGTYFYQMVVGGTVLPIKKAVLLK